MVITVMMKMRIKLILNKIREMINIMISIRKVIEIIDKEINIEKCSIMNNHSNSNISIRKRIKIIIQINNIKINNMNKSQKMLKVHIDKYIIKRTKM
jgi:hypothetical protein